MASNPYQAPGSENHSSHEASNDVIDPVAFILSLLQANYGEWTIVKKAVEQGIPAETAEVILAQIHNAERNAIRKGGRRKIFLGVFFCLLGLGAMIYTIVADEKPILPLGGFVLGGLLIAQGISESRWEPTPRD